MQPIAEDTAPASRLTPLANALALAGLLAAAIALVACARGDWTEWPTTVGGVLTAVSWLLPGWLVAARRPDLPFGWLLIAGGLFLSVGFACTAAGLTAVLHGSAAGPWLAWVGGWIFFPHLGCQEALYLLFPTGQLLSPRWRGWIVAAVVVNVAMAGAAALGTGQLAGTGVLSHVDDPVQGLAVFNALFPLLALGQNVVNIAGMVAIFRRWRAGEGTTRRVLGVVFGLGVVDALVGVLLIAPIGGWIFWFAVPSTMGLTTAIAWGVLRHGLWDVRLIVRRTVTWLVLTGLLVALLSAGVAVAGRTVGLVGAAALATVVVVPLERRLRRAVDRLLFGDRFEPYAVLSSLGADLEAAGDPVDGLERLVATIRASLKVAYAAVELADAGVAAVSGTPPSTQDGTVVRLPVRSHGRDMGWLVVGQNAGDRPFTDADRLLLDDLARQAGAAAGSVSLTAALQQSRQRLVNAREEERRRLRRELHDGVASALTAINLKVDSAASIAATDPARTASILNGVQADVSGTLNEVRRVVADLRPPALEDLGLFGALNQLAARFDSAGLRVQLDAEPVAPASALPAAVELALYRIATEALQNVARHSGARSCTVRLRVVGAAAVLAVEDDGNGMIVANGGLGLSGMAERADELGGTFSYGRRNGGASGSIVIASLPV